MPFTWELNIYHDLSIRNGKLRVVYGPDEIKQRILVALRHYWQEYFLDVPDGIPWYEVILGSKDKKTVELIIRRKILEVPGVIGIAALTVRYSADVSRQIEIYGTVEVEAYEGTIQPLSLQFYATESGGNEFASTNIEFADANWQFAGV